MSKRILVIDDDITTTELLKMVLEPDGYKVYIANSGAGGLESVVEINPDVVILDLLMPGMNGWHVAREIREISQVPILVLSILNSSELVAKVLDEGADDFLAKPVPSNILIAHLKKLTRRAHAEKVAAIPHNPSTSKK